MGSEPADERRCASSTSRGASRPSSPWHQRPAAPRPARAPPAWPALAPAVRLRTPHTPTPRHSSLPSYTPPQARRVRRRVTRRPGRSTTRLWEVARRRKCGIGEVRDEDWLAQDQTRARSHGGDNSGFTPRVTDGARGRRTFSHLRWRLVRAAVRTSESVRGDHHHEQKGDERVRTVRTNALYRRSAEADGSASAGRWRCAPWPRGRLCVRTAGAWSERVPK